jgi:hypothetical protein
VERALDSPAQFVGFPGLFDLRVQRLDRKQESIVGLRFESVFVEPDGPGLRRTPGISDFQLGPGFAQRSQGRRDRSIGAEQVNVAAGAEDREQQIEITFVGPQAERELPVIGDQASAADPRATDV